MTPNHSSLSPTEGGLREQLAAYFLAAPPPAEQTPAQRQEYLKKLNQLGEIERQEILTGAGCSRPMVWGNPVELLQALLTAAQRLGAGLGQPLLLFPAKETDIRLDTLLHPRLLSVAVVSLLRDGVTAAPRRPLWVRLAEQSHCLAVSVTAEQPFGSPQTTAILKECTKLHSGSLVHCKNTVLFSCGEVLEPPPGVRLYTAPTAEELLRDTLSPVWTGFYAGVYSSLASSKGSTNSVSGNENASVSDSSSSGADTD
ncbi:MAG: hypothetical protein IJO76_03245 [Clostridia bacterium]|nr:hypothetical protein [Clostridia bacterium]